MLEPKDITVDEMDFQFQPLPALTALKLDKKIIALIVPALGGIEDISMDTKIDIKLITQGIGDALGKLEDEVFEKLILDLLSTTIHKPKDGKTPPLPIDKAKFNELFPGKLPSVYKLVFEVMKYNKFSPFALGVGGLEMKRIISLREKTKKEKDNGTKSEKLESSQES